MADESSAPVVSRDAANMLESAIYHAERHNHGGISLDDAKEALAALRSVALETTPAARGGGAWLPIESAPKDGTEILAEYAGTGCAVVNFHPKKGTWWSVGIEMLEPTAWMPLPAPPGAAPEPSGGERERLARMCESEAALCDMDSIRTDEEAADWRTIASIVRGAASPGERTADAQMGDNARHFAFLGTLMDKLYADEPASERPAETAAPTDRETSNG